MLKTKKYKYPKLPRHISDRYLLHLETFKKNLREDILWTEGVNTEDPVIQKILSYLE